MRGAARREVADILRPIVLDNAMSTQRLFTGKPLPLAGDLAALPSELAQMHLRLAQAYRMAAFDQCAPSGSLPWLRGRQVGESLQPAGHHYGEAMRVAWRVYADVPAEAWRGLHRVLRFATATELDRRPHADPLVPQQPTLLARYVQVLTLDVLNPRGFSQTEQGQLWTVCEAFAAQTLLREVPSTHTVGVPDDADEGAGGRAPARQYLDLSAFVAAVDTAIVEAGSKGAAVSLMQGLPAAFGPDALQKIRRAFSQAAARQFNRLDGGHEIETVLGLSGLHFQASGERDFDAFARQVLGDDLSEVQRAAWAAGSGEVSSRAGRVPATVVDQSLGGYRIRWAQDAHLRLRVGEVVGVRVGDVEDPADWMLGILRWLRYEGDGHVMAGIELVSRSVAPVAFVAASGTQRPPLRALELRPPQGGGEWLYLSSQRLPLGEALRIGREQELVDQLLDHRPEDRVSDLRLLQALGDYFLYRYTPPASMF